MVAYREVDVKTTVRRLRSAQGGLGFTLVELLIVIGIIALLISILLPTLSKTREAANRTKCLSNMRQLYTSLLMYSEAFNDRVPLGCWASSSGTAYYQQNYMVWYKGKKSPMVFGLLWANKFAKEPQAFYCPSDQDPANTYNGPDNPWPPSPDSKSFATWTPPGSNNVRIDYASRPVDERGNAVAWTGTDPWPDATEVNGRIIFPKLSRYKNHAILADYISSPESLAERHKTGVNVLFGNGGAKWVTADKTVFLKNLNLCNKLFSSGFNTYQANIWADLDAQQ